MAMEEEEEVEEAFFVHHTRFSVKFPADFTRAHTLVPFSHLKRQPTSGVGEEEKRPVNVTQWRELTFYVVLILVWPSARPQRLKA